MKKLAAAIFFVCLLSACQAKQTLVRVPFGDLSQDLPKIASVKDLGSLALSGDGPVDLSESDGLFVAGEWVAIVGRGLNSIGAKLFLDETELPIAGGIEGGGLLLRLPREVKFRHTYTLRVVTERGSAEHQLAVTNLIAMSDPREARVLFWRSTEATEQKALFEEDYLEVPCPGAGPAALARTGGILYVTAKGEKSQYGALKTIHIGARGGPQEVSSMEFTARYAPVSLVLAEDGSHAFLLTRGEFMVFDLSVPQQPRLLARQELTPSVPGEALSFRYLVLIDGGNKAAMLDKEHNLVRVLDLSHLVAPAVLGDFVVGAPAPNSYSVGLTADPANRNGLLVLTGVTKRQLRQRLSGLWSDKPVEETPTRGALVRMAWRDNTLVADPPMNLPEGVLPLGLYLDRNGDMLVSALAYEKERLAKTGLSLEGVGNLLRGVRDSIFAGRVYRVTPAGTVSVEMRSVNIPLSISRLEDSPLIYSIYRLSINYVFLSAKVVLAVDALKKQSLPVRTMSWKTILPPYKFMHEIMLI
ncbi:MAG: hypothetical protein ABFS18_14630 [Thermodesulfobacteriota bacterium]